MPRLAAAIPLRPTKPVPPPDWTGAWVRWRLHDAYAIERRLPRGGRCNGGTGWPTVLHDFADMVHWHDARARVWADWSRATGAYPYEITRMEEAFGWLAVLIDYPGERRCLVAWAQARGSLRRMLKRRGWSRSTFYRRVEDGSERIAAILNMQGAKVR